MSWHYSRALVEASLAVTCSGGGASAPSNTTTTPGAFSWPDKTTGASRRSRSGMTCEPLTDARGEAVLTWCLADSLARTSVAPERVPGSPANDPACGAKWRASSVRFDRDSCGWKTARCLFTEDLPWYSVTLPRWGSMHGGELWERTTLPPRISGTGFGCWVGTPTASMTIRSPEFARPSTPTPAELAKAWPTPRAADFKGATSATECTARRVQSGEANLCEAVMESLRRWPTPKANSAGPDFAAVQRGRAISLQTAVAMFPTPCASEARQGFQNRTNGKRGTQQSLSTVVQGAPAQQAGGALNPTWVEWLMGWPLGWTDCGASATDRFREWCSKHGRS